MVSHDREFMDNMIDRVAEVANGRVNLYKGNYSAYLKAREERIERLRQQRTKQLEEMKHLETSSSASATRPPSPPGPGARTAPGAPERGAHRDSRGEEAIHFNFVQPPRTGDEVVRCRGW